MILMMATALCCAIVYFAVSDVLHSRREAIAQALRDARNLCQAVTASVESTVRLIDRTLLQVVREAEANGLSRAQDVLAARQSARPGPVTAEPLFALIMLAPDGAPMTGTVPGWMRPTDVVDEAFFRSLTEDQNNYFIGTVRPRIGSDDPMLAVSRAIRARDGTVAAVLVGIVDPEYFRPLLQSIDVGREGAIAVLNHQGQVILREPTLSEQERTTAQFSAVVQSSVERTNWDFAGIGPGDDVNRVSAAIRLMDMPLIVVTGIDTEFVLAEWYAKARSTSILTSISLVVIGLGAWMLVRQIRKDELARRYLEEREAALREAHALLDVALENMDQGLVMFDRDMRIVLYNRKAVALFGNDPNKDYRGISLVESHTRLNNSGWQAVDDTSRPFDRRLELVRDGVYHRFVVKLPGDRFLDATHIPLGERGSITTYSEITERERAARELAVAKETAERASRAKSSLLANVSHELRTPLNAIIGFSDVMQREYFGPLGERYRDYSGSIHRSGLYLLNLINDLLDLSKIEADRYDLSLEDLDAGAVLTDALEMLRIRAEEKGIALICRIGIAGDETLIDPLQFRADRRAIQQILLNLLSNAVKFTGTGGQVIASVTRRGDGMLFAIEDNGSGIPDNMIEEVMNPFIQVESAQTRTHEGTGLGLAIAKRLADLHGGSLTLSSKEGVGTRATVWLPVTHTRSAPTAGVLMVSSLRPVDVEHSPLPGSL